MRSEIDNSALQDNVSITSSKFSDVNQLQPLTLSHAYSQDSAYYESGMDGTSSIAISNDNRESQQSE